MSYIIQHRICLIIFSANLQTIITAQMMSENRPIRELKETTDIAVKDFTVQKRCLRTTLHRSRAMYITSTQLACRKRS